MNLEDRKITVTTEDDKSLEIIVLDIIESDSFNKEFIIYTIGKDSTHVFASIMNNIDDNITLEKIENKDEIEYINQIINETVLEEE